MTLPSPTPEAFAVIDALRERGGTVATAESLTGGLLCATLVGVPGASDVVRGGIVAYAADLKASLLGVPHELVEHVGTVAGQTAVAMAQGVRELLRARYGLATTGVAGPDLVEGKPVGLVFVAVAGPDEVAVRQLQLSGDRGQVRASVVAAALRLLVSLLVDGSTEAGPP